MQRRLLVLIGAIWFVLAFTLSVYPAIGLTILAIALCLAVVVGFVWQGHRTRKFCLRATVNPAAQNSGAVAVRTVRIEGRDLSPGSLPSRFEFTVRCRNIHMLAAILFISGGSLVAVLSGALPLLEALEPESERYWLYYLLCCFFTFLAVPAWAWISECSILRHPAICLANVHPQQGKLVTYDFKDPQGGYHGGTSINFGGAKGDHLKVVLCLASNLDANKVSSSLLFHRVSWEKSQILT